MYKIKKLLPLKARLQIYHNFVQSHINFCSLVWGFSCKSNIEAIFCRQKKGLHAVIPGFINYNNKDGIIPGHTKQYFNEYNILTIHNTIALNALVMLNKIVRYALFPLCYQIQSLQQYPLTVLNMNLLTTTVKNG